MIRTHTQSSVTIAKPALLPLGKRATSSGALQDLKSSHLVGEVVQQLDTSLVFLVQRGQTEEEVGLQPHFSLATLHDASYSVGIDVTCNAISN